MNIVLLEAYAGGSHRQWMEELQAFSRHEINILSLPARHWKWRMHGGAITLAKAFLDLPTSPDLILATDMLDLSVFLALVRKKAAQVPVLYYLHENQLTYPTDQQDFNAKSSMDLHYAFINYHNALAADRVIFNSAYHRRSFLEALPYFLSKYPDYQNQDTVEEINRKSSTIPVGIHGEALDLYKPSIAAQNKIPIILWNHRWEYDKNPSLFFETLFEIKRRNIPFKLVVLGYQARNYPDIFDRAKKELTEEIIHFGYASSRVEYIQWLWNSNILPVTSNQDFFGISVVEAMYCQTTPILPKRLAYPEHVPQAYHAEVFYEEDEQLLELLVRKLTATQTYPVGSWVEKYDWKTMVEQYDLLFEENTASGSC
ncbi:MAG: DUF3524 domain-containing protein [Saprospiraceae bacterium]|nr:DUF3524 domain-containing protein [Saprospiraceae bacterium]